MPRKPRKKLTRSRFTVQGFLDECVGMARLLDGNPWHDEYPDPGHGETKMRAFWEANKAEIIRAAAASGTDITEWTGEK